MPQDTEDKTKRAAKLRLTGLVGKEVSLVDSPAIEEKFNVVKSKEGKDTPMPNATAAATPVAVPPVAPAVAVPLGTKPVAKGGDTHAALLAEKLQVIMTLAKDVADNAESMELTDLREKIWTMSRMTWELEGPAEVVSVLSATTDEVSQSVAKSLITGVDPSLATAFRAVAKKATDTADAIAKAEWSAAYINDLPDSAFLYIAPGGSKDADGKTTPRDLRYFPVKDADGKVDEAHLNNALARIPQSDLSDGVKAQATAAANKLKEASMTDEEKKAKEATEKAAADAKVEEEEKAKKAKEAADKAEADAKAETKKSLDEIKGALDKTTGVLESVTKRLEALEGTRTAGNATPTDGSASPVKKDAGSIWEGVL